MRKLSNQEILDTVAQDHAIVQACLHEFKKMALNMHKPEFTESRQVLIRIIGESLPEHFKFEDDYVYPQLRRVRKNDVAVLEQADQLAQEHAEMRREIEPLLELLESRGGYNEELFNRLLKFVFRLQRHAQMEDEFFRNHF